MLLEVHESIPQSWMESLLPDREVLSCDPSLGLASSCRQKPCAHMCWAQSIHVCHRQEWENILALGRFSFLCPLLNCSHWLRWICVVPYPVDSSVLVSSWSSTDGVHIIHYWEGPFSFPQAEKSWGGISAPSAALQRPEKHRKSLNGNRKYPLQCVSGVQSRWGKKDSYFRGKEDLGCAGVCFGVETQYSKSGGLRYFAAPFFFLLQVVTENRSGSRPASFNRSTPFISFMISHLLNITWNKVNVC